MAPGPEPTWTGIYDAIEENIQCVQESQDASSSTVGRPDCLHLNVYIPNDTSLNDSLPVMVYIHGGGFLTGSGSPALYGPVYLTRKGVILVTINYRLNVQGFLCLGIKEAPGNAGLKDQAAALKWVKRNIKAFGGDPDNVTIFGESAGAASVSYHILSPMSKGVFHKAIMQSGTSVASWASQLDPVRAASQKAKQLGLESMDPRELYNFLNNQSDVDLITKKVPREQGNTVASQFIFAPCVEKQFDDVEPFVTKTPYEIYSKGDFNKVPMIIGVNSEEGLYFVNLEEDHFLQQIKFNVSLPRNLAFPSNKKRNEIAKKVQKVYMGNEEVALRAVYNYSRFLAESFFEFPMFDETDLIVLNSEKPIYNYLFDYDGRRNVPKLIRRRKEFVNVTGATHVDDLLYLFSQQIVPTLFENEMIDKMTAMWTNFAKYGNPTPDTSDLLPVRWPPLAKEEKNQEYLLINENLSVHQQKRKPSMSLWKDIYQKYRRTLPSY